MKSLTKVILLNYIIFATACVGGSCQNIQREAPDAVTAITSVNVRPKNIDTLMQNQTVLIKEGKIAAVGPSDLVTIPEEAMVIDGSGKYLIPGLSEMHAHIPGDQNGMEIVEETLFLYLSNGITTIRGMLGRPFHLELKKQVANNEVLSPRIFTSGPSLNGRSVKTVEEAREKVIAYKEDGYDFLKMHPGIKLEVFNEIVKTANQVDIPFAGHVSNLVGIRRSIEAKYASIDHIDGYLEGLVSESEAVDPSQNGFFGYNFTDLANEEMLPELTRMTKDAGVWVVPTQSLMERWAGPIPPQELAEGEEMKYVSKEILDSWVKRKVEFQGNSSYNLEKASRFNLVRRKIIKALHEEGVGILLGSDAPQIFNVPGFSIQHELYYMVESGLSPFETLKSGTINPAIYFDMEGQFGTVTEGAAADLILLNSNPLEDIINVSDKSGVMVRGKWLSQEEISERLNQIAAKYAEEG